MFRTKPIAGGLALAFGGLASALLVVGPAAAQQQPQAAAQPEKLERVEVTGSRILRIETESESPVSVITAKEIAISGQTDTVNITARLPSVYVVQDTSQSNGATGTGTIDLRNIGTVRTLTLLNGRRMAPGSPLQGGYAPNINFIPGSLIQRVDVLTGGASSIYGSDAVAGVVNYVLNDRFEGVQIDYNLRGNNHQQDSFVGDIVAQRAQTNPSQFKVPDDITFGGRVNNISLTMGSNFADNKGNATMFLGYQKTDPILQADYDYSSCAINSTTNPAQPYVCGGSGTAATGRFTNLTTGRNFTIADAQGNVRPFANATDQYNFAPTNYYQRPRETWSAFAFAHYDVLPQVRVYGEFGFMNDQTTAQIAPSGIFVSQQQLSTENPLLSPSFISALGIGADPTDLFIGRRNVEGGGRQDNIEYSNFRNVLGAKGDVFDQKLSYNVWGQYQKNNFNSNYQNDFSNARIARALDVVTDPSTGRPVCRSVLNGTDPNCVPYNIFQSGGVTSAALAYLQTPGFQSGYTAQTVWGLNLSSDLGAAYGWTLPTAKNGLAFAGGLEWRRDSLQLLTDTAFSTGDLAGQGGASIGRSGNIDVWEPYIEFRLPIAEDLPGIKSMNLTGSYRYSDYSNSAGSSSTANTYSVGGDYSPIDQVKLRGTYSRAIRAANINELFLAQGNNLFDLNADPCGPNPTATVEECLRTGLPASQYGSSLLNSPAGQYTFLQGGNTSLKPETANTWTLGLVAQPLPTLSATIDYWSIDIKDVIGNLQPSLILNQCLESGLFCDQVQRDGNGTLWVSDSGGQVVALNQNLGGVSTSGVDLGLNWSQPVSGWGTVGAEWRSTWVASYKTQPLPNGPEYDCAGYYGSTCGSPSPEWRNWLRFSWNTPWNVFAGLTWRYIGAVEIDSSSSDPQLAGAFNPPDREIGSQQYWDLALTWTPDKVFTVRAGINNLFDKDPPVVNSNVAGPSINGNGNTFPGVYSYLGRSLWLGLTAKF